MQTIHPSTRVLDAMFLGRPGVIATGVIDTPDGVLLVDPGPSTCWPGIRSCLADAGIAADDLRGLLLTHIHLDHAGASGTIVRACPRIRVYVHERGAVHLADPSRLLASATRLYGADMDRLWGEFAAVPADRLAPLAGGERLVFGSAAFEVAYTPGHASHHVSYFDTGSGIAFTGDTGGIRVGGHPYVLPPTPPPDIAFEPWHESLAQYRRWQPSGFFVTHFGYHADAGVHLEWLAEELLAWERVSRDVMETEEPGARLPRFVAGVTQRIEERAGAAAVQAYAAAVPFDHCWQGLERCWSKRLGER